MAISANTQVNLQQDAPANQLEAAAAVQRTDVVASNIANDSIIGLESQVSAVDTGLNTVSAFLSQTLTGVPAVNEAIQNGIDIDQITGVNVNNNAFESDYWANSVMMESMMQDMQNGMIGGHHWSEFAEFGPVGDLNKIAGVALETYECTSDGMTRAWNKKEQSLLDQTGEGTDLNGDGYVGDAPTGDECGGSASLFSWAASKIKAWWNSSDEEEDSGDNNSADKPECFEKPWLYEESYSLGLGGESYTQQVFDYLDNMQQLALGSSINVNEQNAMNYSGKMDTSPFGYQQQVLTFQAMQMA